MKKGVLIGIIAAVVVAVICCVVFLGKDKPANNDELTNNTSGVETTLPAEGDDPADQGSSETAEVINKVIATYAEEEKFFAMGGDMNNPVDGAAGVYSLEDKEGLMATLHVTEDLIGQVDEVASYMHAMNANTFTGAAFSLKDASTADAFAADLKDSILATQWMCGIPEKVVIYSINNGEYVVYAVGATDLIDNFSTKLETVYGDAAVEIVDEAIA